LPFFYGGGGADFSRTVARNGCFTVLWHFSHLTRRINNRLCRFFTAAAARIFPEPSSETAVSPFFGISLTSHGV
jgi:hypothetical protein